MSILILQTIIKQWDKSQRTQKHIKQRGEIADHNPVIFPHAFYVFDKQCVIDQHGDDLLGDRIVYSQPDNDTIQIDRFQISLSNKTLEYLGLPNSNSAPRTISSLDNGWVQCKYVWRYSVYEGGFYYWLYEEITLNAIYVDTLDENVFISEPERVILD